MAQLSNGFQRRRCRSTTNRICNSGPYSNPVVDILQILATLTGNDFDKGMDVGMSNSPDNWEYKFSCSKEIPVIQFPSPEELTLDPTPP